MTNGNSWKYSGNVSGHYEEYKKGWYCPKCKTFHSPDVLTCPNDNYDPYKIVPLTPWQPEYPLTPMYPYGEPFKSYDCSCPKDGTYVCNNAACPRSIRATC